ncbi:hypothetical protein OG418_26845 [Streptomyces phaeochromogenes]|uniref:hypothetical protein n=1 Tax=Streptomyces phaeochromogenes TaxID=1923 RepID=UPI003247AAC6
MLLEGYDRLQSPECLAFGETGDEMDSAAARVRGIFRYLRNTVEPVATRCMLLGISLIGLTAQFVKPVGDALAANTFAAAALLSLVAYILYDAIKGLADGVHDGRESARFASPPSRTELIDESMAGRAVDVRFMGYTGESIFDQMRSVLMRLHNSPRRVRTVTFRVITPDMSGPMHLPSILNGDGTTSDDPEFREYVMNRTKDYAGLLLSFARRLQEDTRIEVSVNFRIHPGVPIFQMCLTGDIAVFFGFYDVTREVGFPYGQPDRILLDPIISGRQGWDVRDGTVQAQYMVRECSELFEGIWAISAEAPWGSISHAH